MSTAAATPLVPCCVWRLTAEVLVALDDRFGEPVDAYVNGSQVWLRPDGPGDLVVEWRLHPVAGYRRPTGFDTYEIFAASALAAATGAPLPAPLDTLWDGLEAFPAHGDDIEPQPLALATGATIGVAPDASGLVDHQRIAGEWERTAGGVSVIADLLAQLGAT